MKLRFISRTVKMSLISLFLAASFFDTKAIAMAKNIHFVDMNESETPSKEQPHNTKSFTGDFYKIGVLYPEDHRVKLPKRQMAALNIHNLVDEPIKYRILKWEVKDSVGNVYLPTLKHQGHQVELSQLIGNEQIINGGLVSFNSAYYGIPSSVRNIIIDLEIELTSPEGKKVLVKESIPLKQATFTTNFFEGWGW